MMFFYEIQQTEEFSDWLDGLKDKQIQLRVLARLARMECGHLGDYANIDYQISELRFFFGGGLRIYFSQYAEKVFLLLNAGNKSSQPKDILKAREILMRILEGIDENA